MAKLYKNNPSYGICAPLWYLCSTLLEASPEFLLSEFLGNKANAATILVLQLGSCKRLPTIHLWRRR